MKPLGPNYFQERLGPLLVETPLERASEIVEAVYHELTAMRRRGQAFGLDAEQWRDAKIGTEFARLMDFTHFTLAPRGQPGFDFTLRRDDRRLSFDATEAMDHLRNRVVEYDSEWTTSQESHAEISYQEELFARVTRSRIAGKKRDPEKNLVVYVSTGWLPDEDVVEACLARWSDEFRDRFSSLYVLFGFRGLVQLGPVRMDIADWREPPRGDPGDFEEFFKELFGGK